MTHPNGFRETGSIAASPSYVYQPKNGDGGLILSLGLSNWDQDQSTEEAYRGGNFPLQGSACCDPLCRHIHAPPTTTYPRWTFKAKSPDKTWHDPSKKKQNYTHPNSLNTGRHSCMANCLKLTEPSLWFRISLTTKILNSQTRCPTLKQLLQHSPKLSSRWTIGDHNTTLSVTHYVNS